MLSYKMQRHYNFLKISLFSLQSKLSVLKNSMYSIFFCNACEKWVLIKDSEIKILAFERKIMSRTMVCELH